MPLNAEMVRYRDLCNYFPSDTGHSVGQPLTHSAKWGYHLSACPRAPASDSIETKVHVLGSEAELIRGDEKVAAFDLRI